MRACTVPECEKPARTNSADLCKMHYHRHYRHGATNMTARGHKTAVGVGKYRSTHRPMHPLAPPSGRVYVHRIVLFDTIGNGTHACHWCDIPLDWDLPVGHPQKLTADHLNGRRDDNRPENLVPACVPCNVGRGAAHRADQLAAQGFWSNHDTIGLRVRRGQP